MCKRQTTHEQYNALLSLWDLGDGAIPLSQADEYLIEFGLSFGQCHLPSYQLKDVPGYPEQFDSRLEPKREGNRTYIYVMLDPSVEVVPAYAVMQSIAREYYGLTIDVALQTHVDPDDMARRATDDVFHCIVRHLVAAKKRADQAL